MVKEKQAMSSWQKTLLFSLALAGVIGISILVILPWPRNSCEGIFDQTAPKLEAHLEIIKNKGALVVSQEKIQELSDSSQKVGLLLKTCCKVLDRGKLDAMQFQQCIASASAYEKQISFVAQKVIDAAETKEKGTIQVPPEKVAGINQAIKDATRDADNFSRQVEQIKPSVQVKESANEEKEPNNQITAANVIHLGTRVRGAIAAKDRDYFRFRTSDGKPNKTRVILRKLSTGGFWAVIDVYDQVESHIIGKSKDNDHPVSFAFKSTPNSDYYILVKGYGKEHGPYELEIREE